MTWALARRQDEAEAKRFGLFSYGVAVLARFPPPDVSFGIPAFPSSDVSFVHLCSGLCTFHSHGTAPGEPSPVRVRDRRWVSWMKGFLGALSLESICSDFPAGGLSRPSWCICTERQRGREGEECSGRPGTDVSAPWRVHTFGFRATRLGTMCILKPFSATWPLAVLPPWLVLFSLLSDKHSRCCEISRVPKVLEENIQNRKSRFSGRRAGAGLLGTRVWAGMGCPRMKLKCRGLAHGAQTSACGEDAGPQRCSSSQML